MDLHMCGVNLGHDSTNRLRHLSTEHQGDCRGGDRPLCSVCFMRDL